VFVGCAQTYWGNSSQCSPDFLARFEMDMERDKEEVVGEDTSAPCRMKSYKKARYYLHSAGIRGEFVSE